MKNILVIILAVTAIMISSCSDSQNKSGISGLTASEFSDKINKTSSPVIVDVRTPSEFSKGHIQNAVNIDISNGDFENQINKLSKSGTVYVYCLSGSRTKAAIRKMQSDGFTDIYELSGGLMKWNSANLPLTTNTSSKSAGMTLSQYTELLNTDKLVLVDFYAEWCVPCVEMKPFITEISEGMRDKVKVVRINTDDNPELCKELKVDGLPYLVLYKNKNIAWTKTGFVSKEDLIKDLN